MNLTIILFITFLTKNNIQKSYSKPGCPYDNAVAESTYKIFKTDLWSYKLF
ncbi:hypothetical protein [Spiroplasma phoeniceum]|uniref:hypothetical protein n=1 Tax=Spiroplasma phoeniceum TaxID=47835 RepID=UPI0033650565